MTSESDALETRELARRLVARAATSTDSGGKASVALFACERAYRELTRSLGASGSGALLKRAIAATQLEHPSMADVRIGRQAKPDLASLATLVQSHGDKTVAAGLEALLATFLELLGRLIGDDMVTRLVEPNGRSETPDDEDAK